MAFVAKIKTPDNSSYDIAGTIPAGSCDATSTSTKFTASVPGIIDLHDGVCVWLTNGVVTSATNFTVNINNLGEKPVYRSNAASARLTTQFNKAYTALLIYNETRVSGGCWDYVYGYDSDTTYTPQKLGFGYGSCTTAESTTAKVATLADYVLVKNGIISIHFENAVPANSTLNINSKGAKAIYYADTAITDNIINAGDTVTFVYDGTHYRIIAFDREELRYINAIANGGAKNLLRNTATSATVNGITFTVNDDGSITATGTATANADFDINDDALSEIPAGKSVILSGCPAGGGTSTYEVIAYQKDAADAGAGATFTTTASNLIYIRVFTGTTVDHLTFYPMLRDAVIVDDTYVPYAQTNAKLTEEMLSLIEDIIPFALRRGEYTLNENSELTFDTLMETKYYRFTGSAVGNPIPGSYGIVINIRFTAYAVQLCFSHMLAADPTRLVFRLGVNMTTTPLWRAWREVSTTELT